MRTGVIILILVFIFSKNNSFAQVNDPKFLLFKNNYFGKNFEPVLKPIGGTYRIQEEFSFTPPSLFAPVNKKPMFCRMEDNFSKRYNVVLQFRAGTDEQYRKMAFPEEIDKTKKTKLIE